MLRALHIANFIRVQEASIDFQAGMTVITGETGAGKSLLLNALSLCLGERANAQLIYPGAKQATLSVEFDISDIPHCAEYLEQTGMVNSDEPDTCIIRRVLGQDGRSRSFINGQPATLNDLKTAADYLVDLHTQHNYQALLRQQHQRALLDEYAEAVDSAQRIAAVYAGLREAQQQLEQAQGSQQQQEQRRDWLQVAVTELQDAAPEAGELQKLQEQEKRLANVEQLLADSASAFALCDDDEQGAVARLSQAQQLMDKWGDADLARVSELLNTAGINASEARDALLRFKERLEQDPEQLQKIQQRLDLLYSLSRKHQTEPEQLGDILQGYQSDLADLKQGLDTEQLQAQVARLQQDYDALDADLHRFRVKAAARLGEQVNARLGDLFMQDASFRVSVQIGETLNTWGRDAIAFEVTTHPGADFAPLAKVASGGELSRISLAIEVALVEQGLVPTLVFDEVDVGIGGRVAEVVGILLRQLAQGRQVLCVTHQAQVAALGEQHLRVQRHSQDDENASGIAPVQGEQRVEEIARMIGGLEMTPETLAHAKRMLKGRA